MVITKSFNLDINTPWKAPTLYIKQGDVDSRKLQATIRKDGTNYSIPGDVFATFRMHKPDDTFVTQDCTISGSVVSVVMDAQCATAAGHGKAEFVLQTASEVVSTFLLAIEVMPAAVTDGDIESRDALGEYRTILEEMLRVKGAPLVANTAADMTDTDRVYVYTGSEVGYVNGSWYYYDGDSWEVGGVYNSVAVQTDPTLSVEGAAADAKAVGEGFDAVREEIGDLNQLDTTDKSSLVNALNEVQTLFTEPVETAVDDWLDEHPEATTTVQDGSITEAKLASSTIGYIDRYIQTKTGTTTGGDTQSLEVGVEQEGALNATQNVVVGSRNLQNNTTGTKNVAIGHDNLINNTTGEKNTAIGYHSNFRNTTGHDGASIGAESMDDNTTGVWNTGLGAYAVQRNSKGNYNTGVGGKALRGGESTTFDADTTMTGNTAVGYSALLENRSGNGNTALGYSSLSANLSGSNNVSIGYNSSRNLTASSNNIAIGTYAFDHSTDTNGNQIAIGTQALYEHTSGVGCVAIGKESQRSNATGAQNTSVGYQALQKTVSGTRNTAIGYNALQAGTSGDDNTSVGYNALNANSGNGNVAIGSASAVANTTGIRNTAVGYSAFGLNTTGSNNIAVGYASNRPSSSYDNTITIGNSLNPTGSNQCLIGVSDQAGGLYLCGKHIIFNSDGTVTWE